MLRHLPVFLAIAAAAGLFLGLLWCRDQAHPPRPPVVAPAHPSPAPTPAVADDVARQRLALFFGRDDRQFIAAPYPQPYAAIGRLETAAGSTCTATLVGENLAVTAAHCFLMEADRLDPGRWFYAGYHRGKYQARYRVLEQVFPPRFRRGLRYQGDDVYIEPEAAAYDIAWLKLEKAEGIAPEPLPIMGKNMDTLKRTLKATAQRITQAGYAEDHDTQLTSHRHCRITELRENRTLFHQCDTLAGDSGSPLFVETAEGPRLIAVQSSAPDWFNRGLADNVAVTVLQLPKPPQ
ncbi:trypsin-like serine peptidase [Chitinilyticum litopenaei]|uniref:trypsin-like serine peptidase n=1 Tax=Chitinilyticum litopenaei TaxID=1121276 RepID=UPI0009DBEA95|nr:trypsin-like serine protease [Chitinilyticum litopenaei]